MFCTTHNCTQKMAGSALLLTLFFSSIFLLMFGATLSYIMVQHTAVQQQMRYVQSVHIVEAGTQYYRWHLAHDPNDFMTDTGTHSFTDLRGDIFGQYTIAVTPPSSGSTVATITSEGVQESAPNTSARTRVRYGKPSLTHYAFITNSNVWFGAGEEISGQLHSNGGVRMDGEGDSIFTSAQETYICGAEHGCDDPNDTIRDGIWGSGEDPALWHFPAAFPVTPIDFTAILLNFDNLQTQAKTAGIYLPDSGQYGYFIQFQPDGTFDVNTVTAVYSAVSGYDGMAWVDESNEKYSWSPLPGYQDIPLPVNGIIFAEDDIWISGEVRGRVTVAAARLPDGSFPRADIYIQEDITYTARDGTNALGLIAQQDILVPLRSDTLLEIDGALMAVNGHVFRYRYKKTSKDPYKTYAIRDRIETYGVIISNTMWTWSWVSTEGGSVTSGYTTTETTYDPDLTYAPPPLFPTEDEYSFIS